MIARYYTNNYHSPSGNITLVGTEKYLTGAWFIGQKYFPDLSSVPLIHTSTPLLDAAFHWLDLYFQGLRPTTFLPVAPQGTPFQRLVWEQLLRIPYGRVTTYGRLACRLKSLTGKKQMAAQAIGNAVGHNPISIFIPCHRIIGSDGKLTGYAGGINKKAYLLSIEQADKQHFFEFD